MNNIPTYEDNREPLFSPATVEHQLAATLESFLDGFFSCDDKWRFVYINTTAERILGIDRNMVLGKSHWEVFPLTLGTILEQEYRRAAGGEVRDFENYYDPWRRWFHTRCFPREGGGISVYFQEITEQKQREEDLLRERHVLQTMLDCARNVHVVYLDCNFNFVRVNKAYAATCGYQIEEMIGKNHFFLYPHPENEAIFKQVLVTGEPYSAHDKPFEFRDQPERGTTWWDWTITPEKNQAGKVVGLIFSLFETTRLKITEQALRASEEQYRAVVEDQTELIARYLPSNRVHTFVNEVYCRFFGKKREELLGQSWQPVAVAEDFSRIEVELGRISPANPVVTVENRVYDGSGAIRWMQFVNRGFFDLHGRLLEIQAVGRDITTHKLLEEKLQISEEKYRALVESSSDCIWQVNPTGCFAYLSPKFQDLTGYLPEDFLGRSPVELAPIEEVDAWGERLLADMATQQPFATFDFPIVHRDGRSVSAEVTGVPFFDIAGEFLGMRGVARDNTARKKLTNELQENEEKYRRIFENELLAIFLYDVEAKRFVSVNDTHIRLYGYSREEMLNNISILDLSAEPEKAAESINQVITTGTSILIPQRLHKKKDGTVFPVEIVLSQSVCGGQLTLIALVHDITDQKQMEENLRQSEAYSRSLIEANLDPLVVINPDGRIKDVNEASTQATGSSREEMIGTDFSSYFTSPSQAEAGYRKVFKKGTIRNYPLEVRHRDGHITPVLYNATVFKNEDTGNINVFASARDITIQKQLEERLRTFNNELEQKVEQRTQELQETQKMFLHAEKLSAIGKLSASIAHEFNNPLQGVLSILKGLKKRAILEEEDGELLDAAINESDRMKDLIHSLQHFNRPSTEKKELMDIHKSMDSLLILCKSDFRNKQISLIKNYAENLPLILAVSDQIKQVFLNLITNAAEACQQPDGIITISTRKDKEYVIIAINDTGTGIKGDNIEKIFQPFFTTKATVKGTGLGLSVSYGIVKNHGGQILVESEPEKGTTFTLILPIKGTEGI